MENGWGDCKEFIPQVKLKISIANNLFYYRIFMLNLGHFKSSQYWLRFQERYTCMIIPSYK